MTIDRARAWALLTEYTHNPNLIKHALAVEACMRHYARHFGADPEIWGVVGLIHDFDYERWPDLSAHPLKGAAILAEQGWPPELIHAVCSHANYLQDRYPRTSLLDKTLFAVDELSGFVIAVALVKDKNLFAVDVAAVKKRLKQKNFAAGVNRADVEQGIAELGVEADFHYAMVIEALQGIAGELGLAGAS